MTEAENKQRIYELQSELLAICRGGSFAETWRKLNCTLEWPNLKNEFTKIAKCNEIRKQIKALNPDAALYYGWAGYMDKEQ